jgi:hypothetical protein
MKIFWRNDSLCLTVENDAERNALKLVHAALLQTTVPVVRRASLRLGFAMQ